MKITILSDNTAIPTGKTCSDNELAPEWELSVYIEYGERKILLDFGASGIFAENAAKLGIDLASVDTAALSHAHYDHSDGMDRFFELNGSAPVYIAAGCGEDCYSASGGYHYIGIKPGMLEKYAPRLIRVPGNELYPTGEGIYLFPHILPDAGELGRGAAMYRETDEGRIYDDFSHEMSLIFVTERGPVVFSSCSHIGADNVLRLVSAALGGSRIYAFVGGLHLFRSDEKEAMRVAERLANSDLKLLVTGHCTGETALELLNERMGERLLVTYPGMTAEL